MATNLYVQFINHTQRQALKAWGNNRIFAMNIGHAKGAKLMLYLYSKIGSFLIAFVKGSG